LSAAEWEWISGEPSHEHVNAFEALQFQHPATPRHFDYMDSVLDRAQGVVSAERIADRRAYVRELRARDRELYPLRPEYRGERIHG
jgi:hypothetical protein